MSFLKTCEPCPWNPMTKKGRGLLCQSLRAGRSLRDQLTKTGGLITWTKHLCLQKASILLLQWMWTLFMLKSFSPTAVQFSSVVQSCPTLCDPMDCGMPGLPVHHQLLDFTETQVHWVGDAIQPSHLLSSLSQPAFHLSRHQGLFKWVSSSHQVAKVLKFQLQLQSFQWIFQTDFL